MKLLCQQKNLAKGLSIVGRVATPHPALPAQGNVWLTGRRGLMKLAATDADLAITCWIVAEADDQQPGGIVFPAHILRDFVNSIPPFQWIEIDLDDKDKTLQIRRAHSRYRLRISGDSAGMFNRLQHYSSTWFPQWIETLWSDIRTPIEQAVFAAATADSRPVLTGVLVKFENDKMTFVATDGYRLSVSYVTLDEPVESPLSIIVPAKVLRVLAHTLGVLGDETCIETRIAKTQDGLVVFGLKTDEIEVELVAPLISGEFPDFTAYTTRQPRARAVVATNEFQSAVRVAESVAHHDIFKTIWLFIADGGVSVSTEVSPLVTCEIGAVTEGTPSTIALNAGYLLDALNAVATSQVVLEIGNGTPLTIVLRPNHGNFVHVIMPIYVPEQMEDKCDG